MNFEVINIGYNLDETCYIGLFHIIVHTGLHIAIQVSVLLLHIILGFCTVYHSPGGFAIILVLHCLI